MVNIKVNKYMDGMGKGKVNVSISLKITDFFGWKMDE